MCVAWASVCVLGGGGGSVVVKDFLTGVFFYKLTRNPYLAKNLFFYFIYLFLYLFSWEGGGVKGDVQNYFEIYAYM